MPPAMPGGPFGGAGSSAAQEQSSVPEAPFKAGGGIGAVVESQPVADRAGFDLLASGGATRGWPHLEVVTWENRGNALEGVHWEGDDGCEWESTPPARVGLEGVAGGSQGGIARPSDASGARLQASRWGPGGGGSTRSAASASPSEKRSRAAYVLPEAVTEGMLTCGLPTQATALLGGVCPAAPILSCQLEAAQILGLGAPEELVGRHLHELVADEDLEAFQGTYAAFVGGRHMAVETRLKHPLAGHVVARLAAWRADLSVPQASFLVTLLQPVSRERQVQEDELADMRALFANCQAPLSVADPTTGLVADCNEAMARLLGYTSKGNVIALTAPCMEAAAAPEDLEYVPPLHAWVDDMVQKAIAEGDESREVQLLHRDGSSFPALVRARKITFRGRPHHLCQWFDLRAAKMHERELWHAKEAAEAASRAKSHFLAHMSHEIRTPMNGVIGIVDLLRNTPLSKEQHEYLDIIRTSGDSLLRIISDILDLSKIETDTLRLERRRFEVRPKMQEALALLRVVAEEKGIQLHLNIDPRVPRYVIGDALRIRQVLQNLVSNAVKFTKAGGVFVRVRLAPPPTALGPGSKGEEEEEELPPLQSQPWALGEAVMLQIEVQDSGMGVSERTRKSLFTPFMQADCSIRRHYGGTGLGLAVCKSLVNRMGGRIWESSVLGKGATFSFTLSLGRVASREAAGADVAGSAMAAAARENFEQLAVLVVEDNKVNQLVCAKMLKSLGMTCEVAENGLEAVNACTEKQYDVVLMDYHMPVMDGLEATRRIRKLEQQSVLRRPANIVAITASALTHEKEKCLGAGMDAFLTKPVSLKELSDVFHEEASKRRHVTLA